MTVGVMLGLCVAPGCVGEEKDPAPLIPADVFLFVSLPDVSASIARFEQMSIYGKVKEEQERQWSGPRCLPVVHLQGTDYFVDERLRQFREVTNPHHYIDFDSETGKRMLGEFYVVKCPSCGLEVGIPRHTTEDIVICRRCVGRVPGWPGY